MISTFFSRRNPQPILDGSGLAPKISYLLHNCRHIKQTMADFAGYKIPTDIKGEFTPDEVNDMVRSGLGQQTSASRLGKRSISSLILDAHTARFPIIPPFSHPLSLFFPPSELLIPPIRPKTHHSFPQEPQSPRSSNPLTWPISLPPSLSPTPAFYVYIQRRAYQAFDSNGDGHIDATELKSVLDNLGERISADALNKVRKEAPIPH